MKVSVVSQYSVFLANEPGALEKFSQILAANGVDITGLVSDVRYDAAVVKFVAEPLDSSELPGISRIAAKAGYTSVKTDILRVDAQGDGVIVQISKLLGAGNVNINAIYGSSWGPQKQGCIYLTVDDLERALSLLSA